MGNYTKVIEESQDSGILTAHLFNNILPVVTGCRPATAMTYYVRKDHDYDVIRSRVQRDKYVVNMTKFLDGHGLGTYVACEGAPDGNHLMSKVYVFKKSYGPPVESAELFKCAFEQMGRGEPSESFGKGTRADGDYLEYPECAVDLCTSETEEFMNALASQGLLGRGKYITEQQMNELDPSNKRIDEMLAAIFGHKPLKSLAAKEKAKRAPLKDKLCFYTRSFYPCSSGCEKAYDKGNAFYRALEEEDPNLAWMYEGVVVTGNLLHIYSCRYGGSGMDTPQNVFIFTTKWLDNCVTELTGHKFIYQDRVVLTAYRQFMKIIDVVSREQSNLTRGKPDDGLLRMFLTGQGATTSESTRMPNDALKSLIKKKKTKRKIPKKRRRKVNFHTNPRHRKPK